LPSITLIIGPSEPSGRISLSQSSLLPGAPIEEQSTNLVCRMCAERSRMFPSFPVAWCRNLLEKVRKTANNGDRALAF